MVAPPVAPDPYAGSPADVVVAVVVPVVPVAVPVVPVVAVPGRCTSPEVPLTTVSPVLVVTLPPIVSSDVDPGV